MRRKLPGKSECRHMGVRLQLEQKTDGAHDKAVY